MISNETFVFAALGEHQGCDDLLADAISRGREYGCGGAVIVSRDYQVYYTWGNELFSSFSFIMSYSKYLFSDIFFALVSWAEDRQKWIQFDLVRVNQEILTIFVWGGAVAPMCSKNLFSLSMWWDCILLLIFRVWCGRVLAKECV